MNIQRLKFAWARGARIEHYGFHDSHNGKQWRECPVAWVFLPGYTTFRIHPDDAHLEYGPVATAFRDMALFTDSADLPEIVELFMDLAGSNWVFETSGPQGGQYDMLVDFTRLFFAEYLADEGL